MTDGSISAPRQVLPVPIDRVTARSDLPSRRRVLAGAAATSLVVVLDPLGLIRAGAGPARPAGDPYRDLLRAYVSTLVPGPGDDPTGSAGAVEAGAVEQLEAQAPYVIPPLVADLNGAALSRFAQPFAALDYSAREELLVDAFADPDRAPYHLIALAVGAGCFYGDFRNRTGGTHLGFPGPSQGYLATYTDATGHGQPQRDAVPD